MKLKYESYQEVYYKPIVKYKFKKLVKAKIITKKTSSKPKS